MDPSSVFDFVTKENLSSVSKQVFANSSLSFLLDSVSLIRKKYQLEIQNDSQCDSNKTQGYLTLIAHMRKQKDVRCNLCKYVISSIVYKDNKSGFKVYTNIEKIFKMADIVVISQYKKSTANLAKCHVQYYHLIGIMRYEFNW